MTQTVAERKPLKPWELASGRFDGSRSDRVVPTNGGYIPKAEAHEINDAYRAALARISELEAGIKSLTALVES